jgi:O-acetyl-ADP-ribose deacetylase (regulator of RNase III)
MRLHFADINPSVTHALGDCFRLYPEVEILCANLVAVAKHCVVSPANSYGFMDGGIDAAYLAYFGPGIQTAVQSAIARRPEGYLPVGAAVAVKTGDGPIPYLIAAPTMETPGEVPASYAGRALRAVLRLVDAHPELGEDIYCPGLTTLTGRTDPMEAAQSMADAYRHWLVSSGQESKAQKDPTPEAAGGEAEA